MMPASFLTALALSVAVSFCLLRRLTALKLVGRTWLLVAVGSGCATWHMPTPFSRSAKASERSRSQVPRPGPAITFHAPRPVEFQLANGLTVLLVPRTALPLVHASLVLQGGSAGDPLGEEGLAALLVEAAKLGTTKRTAATIAEEMELLGASLDASVTTEASTFATHALKHTLPQALDILADVAMHPTFAPAEVARAKSSQLADLEQLASSPGAIAQVISRGLVYGSHPYGHISLGSAASVAKATPKSLQRHHQLTFVPARAALVLTGDMDEATARALSARSFGSWRNAAAGQVPQVVPAPQPQPTKVALVDRPGAPQAVCHLASLSIGRDAPDYPALVLANAILGGMFNSRINMNLREAKGWTYGARAALTPMRELGLFTLQSALRTDVAVDGIGEMLAEADKMQAAEVSQEELRAAKNRHVLSVAGRLETLSQLAEMTAELFTYGLPSDYWQTLPNKLNAVRVGDVLSAARAHIVPSELNVTVVGDRAAVEPKLLALSRGPISWYDASGKALADAPARPLSEAKGKAAGKPAAPR